MEEDPAVPSDRRLLLGGDADKQRADPKRHRSRREERQKNQSQRAVDQLRCPDGSAPPARKTPTVAADQYRLHPHVLRTSPTGIYIPRDLSDTFAELDKTLSPALRTEMRKGAERDMVQHHFGLGMWIRNNWGLWKGLRLAKWFAHYGIFMPDDMSGIIIEGGVLKKSCSALSGL